jgi:hypothetical protein
MIYEDRYNIILSACQDLQRRREQLVGPVIAGQILDEVGVDAPSDVLLSHIVAEALLRRVDRNLLAGKNIYLQRFEVAQIDLFDLLRKAIPPIPEGYAIANQHLAHALRGLESAGLLDIGIGKGAQVVALLAALAADVAAGRSALRRLRVVALDPSAGPLAEAQSVIEAAAASLPFAVEVVQMRGLIERYDAATLQAALGEVDGVAINSAYALHHTTHKPNDQNLRTELLRRLASLRPRVLTLVEPNANHDTELLTKRVHSCWQHFGAVFELVDRSEATPLEKFAIKEKFFGREVRDILGTSDSFRCERHEPYESWLLRLTKAGLRPYPKIDLEIGLPDYCWAIERDGLVRLGYREEALIAVFAYRSPEAQ